jgi:succinate dehydrogenase / fumarate reductase flavoprotein subunit
MARTRQSLETAIGKIRELREEFWRGVNVPGTDANLNVALERAGRVADFLEFGELLAKDALEREESCGGHFREEYQAEGEAKRDDERFSHVAAWEFAGDDKTPIRNVEPLTWEFVHPSVRSYK